MGSIIGDKDFFNYNVNKMLNELPDDLNVLNQTQLQDYLDEINNLNQQYISDFNLQNIQDMMYQLELNIRQVMDEQFLKDKKVDFLLREEKYLSNNNVETVFDKADELEDNLPGMAGGLIGPLNKGLKGLI